MFSISGSRKSRPQYFCGYEVEKFIRAQLEDGFTGRYLVKILQKDVSDGKDIDFECIVWSCVG